MILIYGALSTGDVKKIPGQGMPSQRHHEPGDMIVKFWVKFPESMEVDKIPKLEQALPPRKPMEKFPKNIMLDEVELYEADQDQRARADGDEPMDEDEGEPRVQCANQ